MTINDTPSEHFEQRNFVSWFRKTYPGVLIFAVPNGGVRSPVAAAKLKVEGVVAGVPDLFIPEFKLWVEMKRQKGGSVSKDQKRIILYLEGVGYCCIVGIGEIDARQKVTDFLKKRNT
jgi:hypothetical protein